MLKVDNFNPDYVIHPGEILLERLETIKMKKSELAKRCGLSPKTISQIIGGKGPITPETAIQFERVLGVSANIWNNLNAYYYLYIANKKDKKKLEEQKDWLKKFPIKSLIKRGFLENQKSVGEQLNALLRFFEVGSFSILEKKYLSTAYRLSPSYETNSEYLITWLRIGEILGQSLKCEPFRMDKFKDALSNIRKLTIRSPDIYTKQIVNLSRRAGVAVVFVEEFKKTHLSGAAKWLNKDRALIMLSLRYKTDDHFWFSFFHEAGHIVLHGKKMEFIDEQIPKSHIAGKIPERAEEQANSFAASVLIPPPEYKGFVRKEIFTEESIKRFAKKLGITPGIVVGRLQHDEYILYNRFNWLKQKLDINKFKLNYASF